MSYLPSRESDTKNSYFYSRKEKSLGVLCSNFLKLYNRDDVDSIGLDEAASRLGVERRRIYDIVNILESVGVLTRKAKNQYSWKGFSAIPPVLDELKVANEHEHGGLSNSKIDRKDRPFVSSKIDSRKEKSLGLLAQNFIKLFLGFDVDLISLDNAATALLGDNHGPTAMRTRVRRLYDIANVFSSLNLIEKTHHPESGKPAFRWLGMKETFKDGSATDLDLPKSKRRAFGTEITNTNSKRSKADFSLDKNSDQKPNMTMPMNMKLNNLENKLESNSLEHHMKHTSKDFIFGPFTPASMPKVENSENESVRRLQNWENLASYHPQYHNPVLDGLFAHYVEAWKSWFVEAAENKQPQVS
ncbi:E2F transcription factor-like E2FF isoform X2 [Cornus florida]|uniref:E2F transcription factor-like E2FF isoform X2 n=1 Tax=Cornus florida TaxID=4283 RepID=UPI00289D3AE7|nr:E2F transcription factor-like E2FF isoform X2 [Cornus florida]